MPRRPRVVLPGQPLHITQRGNNRVQTFSDQRDFECCLSHMESASLTHKCAIHAYVLMGNHFHLLITPTTEFGPAKFMQSVEAKYGKYFNNRFGRTGTLWEGRYKSFVIDTAKYFFDCSRYIELNPVRAMMVEHPGEYPWSSFHCNAIGASDPIVRPHALYSGLGSSESERQLVYQDLFRYHLDGDVCQLIRRGTTTGKPISQNVGSDSPTETTRSECRL